MWSEGDRVVHRFNPELGPGRVTETDGRHVVVWFPAADEELRLNADNDALSRLTVSPGTRALLEPGDERVVVVARADDERVRLADGRVVEERRLWPDPSIESPIDRLARGEVDGPDALSCRLDALRLVALREAEGLGSFLGGRIRLYPHQLHAAERATRSDPVRWLFADEVGLGKTVEACLVLNHLIRTGRAESVLVIAPSTLTVQWLGELWRKFHQVFVLLDEARRRDVEKELGRGFNPFETHRRVVVSLESLVEEPALVERAKEAGFDAIVVDEAHRLERRPGHPGSPAYRAIAPLAALGGHLLLLTATPLAEDAHGFLRLLQLLRPEDFPEPLDAEARLASGDPLPACVSATKRDDVGEFPPRLARLVRLPEEAWAPRRELEEAISAAPAKDELERRRRADRLRRALSSSASLARVLHPARDAELLALCHELEESDPRLDWLCDAAKRWASRGDKVLVFAAEKESVDLIRDALSRRVQIRAEVFHEELPPARRDIAVAQFRLPSGPPILVSTEAGGEGRNFEFCQRLVLFDLPHSPALIEQRIGRLDRIGRAMPVEIVAFRDPAGFESLVFDAIERIGLFEEPLGAIEPELLGVGAAIEEAARRSPRERVAAREEIEAALEAAQGARDRVREAADRELHREAYKPEMADAILARIPDELEDLNEEVIVGVAELLGLALEELGGERRYSITLGTGAAVESLPGVPGGSSFMGSFSRESAVENEAEDFFASGHPLVEGLLAHLEESSLGRSGIVWLAADEAAFGLAAIHRGEGAHEEGLEIVTVDLEGRSREDWVAALSRRPLRTKRIDVERWTSQAGWSRAVRGLAERLDHARIPEALVAVRAGDAPLKKKKPPAAAGRRARG